MKDSLASYLKAVCSDVSDDLISTDCCDRFCGIAQYFPQSIVSIFGWESSLLDIKPQVDFFFCLNHRPEVKQWLSQALKSEEQKLLPEAIKNEPLWQKIGTFVESWQDSESPIAQVEDIWLEFDYFDCSSKSIPSPCFFFSAEHLDASSDYQWWLENTLGKLSDRKISTSTKVLQKCFDKMPLGVEPFQLGILFPREEQLRLYLTFVSYQQLLDYLPEIGWQEDLQLLEHLLQQFAPLTSNFQLQIEVDKKLSEEIAIELYPLDRQCSQQILTHLTNIGFCLPEKRTALLNYDGVSTVYVNNQKKQLTRELRYLKMTYRPGKPILFKAYIIAY